MGDSHTRVSYRRNPNFFERIGNSLVGILVGIALLVVASGLLFWNEVCADKFYKCVHVIDIIVKEQSCQVIHEGKKIMVYMVYLQPATS